MPLDTNIPLSVQMPQLRSPTQALGTYYQIGALQQENQARSMALERARRQQAELDATQQALQQSGGDPDQAIESLYTQGWGTAAAALHEKVWKGRSEQAETLKKRLDNTTSALTLASQIASGMSDEPSFQRGKVAIRQLLGDELASGLGDTYDPAKVTEAVAWGRKASDAIQERHNAVTEFQAGQRIILEAARDAADRPLKIAEARQKMANGLGQWLSAAKNDEDWQTGLEAAKSAGAPPEVLGLFAPAFSPQAAAQAASLAMTPDARADNARADAQLGIDRQRLGLEARRVAVAEQGQRDAESDATNLTGPALDMAAQRYAVDGTLPPMGMGKSASGARTKIINRAAEMYPGVDLAANSAIYKSNRDSLAKLQVQRDAIGSFEQTAMKNIDIFLDTAGKVVDTGSPLANQLARQLSGKVLGSADQAAYDAARQVAVNEIAKITANPNLSGQLSDSARHEVDAFNPREATLAQTVAVMRLLKRDMANRTGALDDAIADVKTRIRQPGQRPDAAAATGAPTDGDERPIPGVAGGVARFTGGKWIRIK